jgi:hypothetical protein
MQVHSTAGRLITDCKNLYFADIFSENASRLSTEIAFLLAKIPFLLTKSGTFVRKKRDICPDIFGTLMGQVWDKGRTDLGHKGVFDLKKEEK